MLSGDWLTVVDHITTTDHGGHPMQNPLKTEPVGIAAAVTAILNVLVLLGAIHLDTDQLAAINTAVVLVLGLFVRSQVTPTG